MPPSHEGITRGDFSRALRMVRDTPPAPAPMILNSQTLADLAAWSREQPIALPQELSDSRFLGVNWHVTFKSEFVDPLEREMHAINQAMFRLQEKPMPGYMGIDWSVHESVGAAIGHLAGLERANFD